MKKLRLSDRLVKYFFVACGIVAVELATFEMLYRLGMPYMGATAASFLLAVILNWILSRKVVFGASHFTPAKEFTLVLIASVFGLAIQSAVVYTSVEVIGLYPFIGKGLSICFSFFWNYWFRARYIFKTTTDKDADTPALDAF